MSINPLKGKRGSTSLEISSEVNHILVTPVEQYRGIEQNNDRPGSSRDFTRSEKWFPRSISTYIKKCLGQSFNFNFFPRPLQTM